MPNALAGDHSKSQKDVIELSICSQYRPAINIKSSSINDVLYKSTFHPGLRPVLKTTTLLCIQDDHNVGQQSTSSQVEQTRIHGRH